MTIHRDTTIQAYRLNKGGERLSEAARVYGSVDLYAGDDGLIYG